MHVKARGRARPRIESKDIPPETRRMKAQITMHNIRPSPALSRAIQSKCEGLDRFHTHILHCRVQVEQSGGRGHAIGPFAVTVRVAVPGHELVADRAHDEDVHIAVRDAFDAMRRQLKDLKTRAEPAPEAAR